MRSLVASCAAMVVAVSSLARAQAAEPVAVSAAPRKLPAELAPVDPELRELWVTRRAEILGSGLTVEGYHDRLVGRAITAWGGGLLATSGAVVITTIVLINAWSRARAAMPMMGLNEAASFVPILIGGAGFVLALPPAVGGVAMVGVGAVKWAEGSASKRGVVPDGPRE